MSLLSLVKNKLNFLHPAEKTAAPTENKNFSGELLFARAFNRRPGLALVTGDPLVGKSRLLSKAAKHLQGCVVHLSLSADLPGWEEAPFHGLFEPEGGNKAYAIELKNLLQRRTPGTFWLEFPSDIFHNSANVAQRLREELCEILREPLALSLGTTARLPRVTLIADDSQLLLSKDFCDTLVRYGKTSDYHGIFVHDSPAEVAQEYLFNAQHIVAFHCAKPSAHTIESALGLSGNVLSLLPPKQFWHKIVAVDSLSRGALSD